MSLVPKKVANWLYSVLQPQYLHKEIAFNHICKFLAVYLAQGFKIRTSVFTSALGASTLLVNLYGLLTCKNIDIPLNIWVPLNYPFADESLPLTEPNGVPLVFVVPTAELAIRPGNNVDLQGRFYHPYLSLWHQDCVFGADTSNFDLLSLMSCLIVTFTKDPPLGLPPVTTGPQLPPKPTAWSPQVAGDQTQLPRRDTNGPPVPQKPGNSVDSVPLKYRTPLPIPSQSTAATEAATHTYSRAEQPAMGFAPVRQSPYPADPRLLPPGSATVSPPHSGAVSPPQSFVNYSTSSFAPQDHNLDVGVREVEDLMDKVTLGDSRSTISRETLEQISLHINSFLTLDSSDNVNSIVAKINENSHRILALHSQLEHHNNQAAANRENTEKHIEYLLGQVDAIKLLNAELGNLDRLNSPTTNEIHIDSSGRKMKLDDIVTPDLKLVHQLYDVTADIKACKDAIKVVGGGFKSEEEIITDQNLDSCVKAVRGLGRELFWLEVTKQNIAKTMGLS